jgi:hypothetical protein
MGNSGISFAVELVPQTPLLLPLQGRVDDKDVDINHNAENVGGGGGGGGGSSNGSSNAHSFGGSGGGGGGGGNGNRNISADVILSMDFTFDLTQSVNVVSQYTKLRTTFKVFQGELKLLHCVMPRNPLEKWSWKSKYGVRFEQKS